MKSKAGLQQLVMFLGHSHQHYPCSAPTAREDPFNVWYYVRVYVRPSVCQLEIALLCNIPQRYPCCLTRLTSFYTLQEVLNRVPTSLAVLWRNRVSAFHAYSTRQHKSYRSPGHGHRA